MMMMISFMTWSVLVSSSSGIKSVKEVENKSSFFEDPLKMREVVFSFNKILSRSRDIKVFVFMQSNRNMALFWRHIMEDISGTNCFK